MRQPETRGFWREIAWPHGRFREKKQQQSRVFLRLSFNVYTDVDINRERARARDKKQRRRILLGKQHDSFISAVRK